MNITKDECAACGSTLERVRPGKWQCSKCELDNMLQQAHRDATEEVAKAHKRGWEQCKREIIAEWEKPYGLTDGSQFIARLRGLEYGGSKNGN